MDFGAPDVPFQEEMRAELCVASRLRRRNVKLLRLVLRTQPRSGRKSDGASAGPIAAEPAVRDAQQGDRDGRAPLLHALSPVPAPED